MNTNTTHTPGATRIAEIIIPEGIDRKGHPSRIATAYGKKTREGIADMIDRETAAPELLERLQDCVKVLQSFQDQLQGKSIAVTANLEYARAAIAKAEGKAAE